VQSLSENQADVIVVGAGPAGSTTAYHLAKAGLDVLLLEKTAFPREKICGDGLTPRPWTCRRPS
jgi:flavin-dependent dehydrogenase